MSINFTKEMIEIIDDERFKMVQDSLNKIEELNGKMVEIKPKIEPLEKKIEEIKEEIEKIEKEKSSIDIGEFPSQYLVYFNEERNKIIVLNNKKQDLDELNGEIDKLQEEKQKIENDLLKIQDSLKEELDVYKPEEKIEESNNIDSIKERKEFVAESFKIDEYKSSLAKTEKRAIEPAKEAFQSLSRVTSDGKYVFIAKSPQNEDKTDTIKTIDEIINNLEEEKNNIQNSINQNKKNLVL